ncbi:hypothetical protein CC85DRAFT_289451 [Cutaneotrichosporon oleaginosum]|uniref:Phosphoglycerate mutase-like protein n=1 Tax=Cutaneotrichosporon oleaginosum TaxID=879819 RepID=A0A0J0XBT2_9TREE|nr:uncharacterized protein CC85DRAFT_289451 [Cutaneotrichosporon oleaginosum]KLT38533.1 hypothetical protein CC85DRAFT_289451 [Cutaneotrichosporon oleaginosum]TXT14689.1 hypothetical protein COLE_00882 [Cutaneotrichosporon oleaginosum]
MSHCPTDKRIFLVRHAQAEHNVFSDWSIHDPSLTPVGRRQAGRLQDETIGSLQGTAQLLVTSPLRRTMETTLIAFPELKRRLEAEGKKVVLLDIAQEVEDLPCDTPLHPREELASSMDGMFSDLDFTGLSPDYASKQGIFDPERAAERAELVRKWLRERPEQEIVLVAHGDILRYIVDGHHSSRRWRNAEVCEFAFQAGFEDPEARLVERRSTHDKKPAVIQTPTPPTSEGSKSPGPMFAMSP